MTVINSLSYLRKVICDFYIFTDTVNIHHKQIVPSCIYLVLFFMIVSSYAQENIPNYLHIIKIRDTDFQKQVIKN